MYVVVYRPVGRLPLLQMPGTLFFIEINNEVSFKIGAQELTYKETTFLFFKIGNR